VKRNCAVLHSALRDIRNNSPFTMGSIADTLSQLRAARDIVLHDPTPYPQVVAGILQVVSPAAQIEARRWGADFLAESFASPVVAAEVKQQMAVLVLDTLGGWLDRQKTMGQEEDVCVVKSAIQCAASIYPFVFRHTVTASDANVWKKMSDIKSTILGRMDTGNPGVRICCIKFATCVVQTQTPGTIADPRRPERNEISLALLPREHSVVSSSILEAQASGLLDRVLSVLQDSSDDALIVTAALNALAPLVQKRPSITAKIITAVLNFDPFKLTRKTMTGRDKIIVRSLTRTTMSFLLNNFKLAKNNIFAGRIQQHLERMKVTLNEAFSEAHQLKRRALDMPVDGLDDTKRQRLSAEPAHSVAQLQQPDAFAPLPDGPISLAQLFTLTRDTAVSTFPVQGLNADIITQLIPAVIQTLSQERIEQVVNAVRSRMDYLSKSVPAPASAVEAVKAVVGEDDDDDYDPTMNFEGDLEQVTNELDQLPREKVATDVAVGPFNLPSPTPLTVAARDDYSKTALTRVFETLAEIDKEIRSRGEKSTLFKVLHLLT
jgi:symplekin